MGESIWCLGIFSKLSPNSVKLHRFLQGKSVKLQYCTMFVYIVSVRNYNNNGVQPFQFGKRRPDLQHFFLEVGMSSYRFGKQFGNKPFKT
jgi:hypothetical protein